MVKSKKQTIIDILKNHPEGLTIQGVSKRGKMSRITATIYLHELLGEKMVTERKIGAYRMFFLKDKYLEPVVKSEVMKKIRDSI